MRRLIIQILIFLYSTIPAYLQPISQKKAPTRAVVIGISDYQAEGVKDLKNYDKAALAFTAYLKSEAGGSITDKGLRLLINETATVGQIVASIDWLMESGKEGERLLLYFAGYGRLESLIPYDTPLSIIKNKVIPFKRIKKALEDLAISKSMELVIITDLKLPFSKGEDMITRSNPILTDSINEFNEIIIQREESKQEGITVSNTEVPNRMTSHLLDAILGRADNNEDQLVSLLETKAYLRINTKPNTLNNELLYIYTKLNNQLFTQVDKQILRQLKKDKNNIIPPILKIDPEHFENALLKKETAIVRHLYQDFVVAIRLKNLLYPDELSANDLYSELIQKSNSVSLQNAAKRNLIAALQDESQQAINAYLRSDPNELQMRWKYGDKYAKYPLFLKRAAKLLGEEHYLYKNVRAKQNYFEGITIRLDAEKLNEGETAHRKALALQENGLQYQEEASFIHNEIGLLYFLMGKIDSAIIHYDKTIELSPQWSIPYSNLCNSYGIIGKWDLAKYYGHKAIQLKPDYATAHNNLGAIYLELNRYKEAEYFFRKAIRLSTTLPYPYYNMACSKAKQGKTALANKWLERAFVHNFDDYDHLKEDSDLESITGSRKYQKLINQYFDNQ